MEEHCIGLEFLGACSYTAKGPLWSFLSIGDVIGVISFLVVFTQLVSVVKREKIPRVGAQRLSLLGTAFIFVPLLLQIIPGYPLPVLGYPVFWEFLSALTFLLIIGWLVKSYHSPLSFKQNQANRTFGIVTRVIAKGEESDFVELAEALTPAIPEIVGAVRQFETVQKDMRLKSGAQATPHAILGIRITMVLSDELFCKAVARREPRFLVVLLKELERSQVRSLGVKQLVWELIKQSLENLDSVLQRERTYAGLGLSKGVTNAFFSSYDLVENCSPLSNWRPEESRRINLAAYEAYCECFLLVIKTYLKAGRFMELSFSLRSGDKIFEHLSSPVYRINNISDADINDSDGLVAFRTACNLLKDCLNEILEVPYLSSPEFIGYCDNPVNYNDYTVLELYSDWVFKAIETASIVRKHEFHFRFHISALWFAIYSDSNKSSPALLFIQKRLEAKIFDRLKDNLERGLYPAISRVMISLFGFHPLNPDEEDYWVRARFYRYLQSRFLALYQMSRERALDKLPDGVTFDLNKLVLVKEKRFWADTDQVLKIWGMVFIEGRKHSRAPFV